MSRHVDALKVLRTRLDTVNLTDWTVRLANRGDQSDPSLPVDGQFIEETPFGNATVDAGVGIARSRRTTGTYQLMLASPRDVGLKPINTLLDALDSAFTGSLMAFSDGVPLLITDVFVGEPRFEPQDAWVRVPFVLTYEFTAP